MLKQLIISNYALISHLNIEFSNGFSVITGETGAGKSIILGALGLILGKRADAKSVQNEKNKCFVEGIFDISSYHLDSYFREKDLEFDANQCILRREIWASGKSRAFINDSPVTLNDLKEFGSFLIDIHSQHQNLLLSDNQFQLDVLDILAGNQELKNSYLLAYKKMQEKDKQLESLKEEMQKKSMEEDYMRFQFKQLEEANLQSEEQNELEEELETLTHLEEIKSGLFSVEQLLYSNEQNTLDLLKSANQQAHSLSSIYAPCRDFSSRMESVYIELKDLASEINAKQESLELDPERLQFIKERLDWIYSLQQKHRVNSIQELLAIQHQLETEIQNIEHFEERFSVLKKELEESKQNVIRIATQLTQSRTKAAKHLEKELSKKVSPLGMPNMQFKVDIEVKNQPDKTGLDKVNFLFSANKSGKLNPVAQIASGGEISRLMLGIKAEIAGAKALPSIIFDEIDTGVSGEIADRMGEIMKTMGKQMQVIAITHLPQIAAKGQGHFLVYKEENDLETETKIRLLSQEERVMEIAQMLSGSELTEAATNNAKALLGR